MSPASGKDSPEPTRCERKQQNQRQEEADHRGRSVARAGRAQRPQWNPQCVPENGGAQNGHLPSPAVSLPQQDLPGFDSVRVAEAPSMKLTPSWSSAYDLRHTVKTRDLIERKHTGDAGPHANPRAVSRKRIIRHRRGDS